MVPLLALTCLWVWKNQSAYRSAGEQWAVAQEKVNERVLQSFPEIKHSDDGADRLLVSGLNAPISPWGYEDFLRVSFGDRKWTVLIPAESADRTGNYLSTKHIAEVNPASYDGVVEYSPDGTMLRALTGRPYFAAVRNDPEQVLVPGLDENPSDFAGLLKAGTMLLTWGDTDRAERYLQQAAVASNGANPYPFFFLGQCAERKHDLPAALRYYEKAVGRDAEPRNPVFQQAVNRLTAQP
jgi:tetratricopeptide (TPR) repeat protein